MRTETQLRDAVQLLAEPTPDADDVLVRLQLPVAAPKRRSGRRPVLVAVGVALALVLIGVLVWPRPTRDATPDPAARRVVGNYSMISQILPPPGWSAGGREVAGTYESSSVGDATGKAWCRVEVDGVGVAPQDPVPTGGESVLVGGQAAVYDEVPGRGIGLYWRYGRGAWASVNCGTFLGRLGTAHTPADVRKLITGLAESVTFGSYPLRVPVGLTRLPTGYRIGAVRQESGGFATTAWGITLEPERISGTAASIHVGASLGSIPDADTRVGPYPATFFTDPEIGGPAPLPGEKAREPMSFSKLCMPTAPVGTCVAAAEKGAGIGKTPEGLLRSVAEQLTYAPSATDTSTWFDANEALPK